MKTYANLHTAEIIRARLEKGKGNPYSVVPYGDEFVVVPTSEADNVKQPLPPQQEPKVVQPGKVNHHTIPFDEIIKKYSEGDTAFEHLTHALYGKGSDKLTEKELEDLYDDKKPMKTVAFGHSKTVNPNFKIHYALKALMELYPHIKFEHEYDIAGQKWLVVASHKDIMEEFTFTSAYVSVVKVDDLAKTIWDNLPEAMKAPDSAVKAEPKFPDMPVLKKGKSTFKATNIVPGSPIPSSVAIKLTPKAQEQIADIGKKFKDAMDAMYGKAIPSVQFKEPDPDDQVPNFYDDELNPDPNKAKVGVDLGKGKDSTAVALFAKNTMGFLANADFSKVEESVIAHLIAEHGEPLTQQMLEDYYAGTALKHVAVHTIKKPTKPTKSGTKNKPDTSFKTMLATAKAMKQPKKQVPAPDVEPHGGKIYWVDENGDYHSKS